MKPPCLLDVDDLWHPEQIKDLLVPLHDQRPDIIVHAYCIPNRLGNVLPLRHNYPWIRFCVHGSEHVNGGECLAWTFEEAQHFLATAEGLGYEKVFKAPNWLLDADIEAALHSGGWILHHHVADYFPTVKGLRVYPGKEIWFPPHRGKVFNLHTHLVRNPSTDWIHTHPLFRDLSQFGEFLRIEDVAMEVP